MRSRLEYGTLAILASIFVAACDGERSSIRAYDDQVRFEILGSADEVTHDGDKFAWTIGDGTAVTIQRLARRDGDPVRTLESVASALRDRFALGEISGECSVNPSHLANGDPSMVVRASIERGRQTYLRRGLLIADASYVYLIDAVGNEHDEALIDEQVRLLAETTALKSR